MVSYDMMMQELLKNGIQITSILQTWLADFSGFMIFISKVLDPRYAYTIFFPVLFHFNRPAGIKVLWTAAIAEWLNHVFKWILFGERPYWWILQNKGLWDASRLPLVQQFPITCETGPGSPSGHVMISCAVLYVFLQGLLELRSDKRTLLFHFIGWPVYSITVILVATSRVFLAAHFPHQCAAGLVLGVLLGYLTNKVPVSKLKFDFHAGMALFTLIITLATYCICIGLNIDPDWSIPLAKMWCAHPEWVHLNTNPFYMLWRYSATILGIGFALSSDFYEKSTRILFSWPANAALSICSIVLAFACTSLIPESPVVAVYCIAFIVHMIIPVIIIGIVPWIAAKLAAFWSLIKVD